MADRLSLHLTPHPRRYSIESLVGDVFREDDDYEGLVLQIEVLDEAEADLILRSLRTMLPHWRTENEVFDG